MNVVAVQELVKICKKMKKLTVSEEGIYCLYIVLLYYSHLINKTHNDYIYLYCTHTHSHLSIYPPPTAIVIVRARSRRYYTLPRSTQTNYWAF